jgi:thiol-disulfide isomerase/thioredoxin
MVPRTHEQSLLRSALAALAFAGMLLLLQPTALATEPALDLGQYRGKVVYLDFWASWCEPCRKAFPWMNAMQKAYGERGLVIIAVNVDTERKDADRFLKAVPASFQVIYDPTGALAQQYQLSRMPSSFIIGPDGHVAAHHEGFTRDSPQDGETEIQRLLAD